MIDVPAGASGPSGTQPSSNYCVLNPLAGTNTLSRGNLQTATASTGTPNTFGTMAVSSGKWYWEFISIADAAVGSMVGIATTTTIASDGFYKYSTGYGYYSQGGQKFTSGTGSSYGSSWTTNDVIGVALDLDAGTLTYYKNNVSQGTAFSSLSGEFTPAITDGGTGTVTVGANFGQLPFAYTPPSGFKALCTANLPVSTIKQGNQFMDATTYTGNGAAQNVVNAGGFSPDLVWIKGRNTTFSNVLYDTIRGATNYLVSNETAAQVTSAGSLTAFNSNGFSVGSDAFVNGNGALQVAWQWDAGSSTVTNTDGSISSQVRANPTAGFSIVTYTGTSANATVGHGLGVAPKMIIFKNTLSGTTWVTYHASISPTNFLQLNTTDSIISSATFAPFGSTPTAPTSSVFYVGNNVNTNNSGIGIVAYCFAEIAGFSKFGIYAGNGSADGPFVYCGFRPKFVMMKNASTTGQWVMKDTSRNPSNVANANLYANLTNAEDTASTAVIDILSNGFKLRATYADINGNTNGIIYMAFAENPFAQANAR
jgi:hypothetical protein